VKVEQLVIPKEQAEEEYQAYKEAIRKHKDQYLRDLKALYGHLRHGRAIIDVYAAMKKAGLNKDGDPRLAICRADSKEVFFEKYNKGAGIFKFENRRWKTLKDDVKLPEGTFCEEWEREQTEFGGSRIKHERISTIVPIIPARILNPLRGALHNYHILWEVKEWKPAPPRDPILLKRLTPNMFVVLATWNLTPLERAVIKGRLE